MSSTGMCESYMREHRDRGRYIITKRMLKLRKSDVSLILADVYASTCNVGVCLGTVTLLLYGIYSCFPALKRTAEAQILIRCLKSAPDSNNYLGVKYLKKKKYWI
jgi:hypothetical protein